MKEHYERTLSENFIRELQDKVDWEDISRLFYHLSESFIIEFKHKLDLKVIVQRFQLSESTIKAIGIQTNLKSF